MRNECELKSIEIHSEMKSLCEYARCAQEIILYILYIIIVVEYLCTALKHVTRMLVVSNFLFIINLLLCSSAQFLVNLDHRPIRIRFFLLFFAFSLSFSFPSFVDFTLKFCLSLDVSFVFYLFSFVHFLFALSFVVLLSCVNRCLLNEIKTIHKESCK